MKELRTIILGGILLLLLHILLSDIHGCARGHAYRLSPRGNPMADFAPISAAFYLIESDTDRAVLERDMPTFISLFAESQQDPHTPKMLCLISGSITNSNGQGASVSIYKRRGDDISFSIGDTYYCAGQDDALAVFAEQMRQPPVKAPPSKE